jgi:predicted heme/steroid binding protein
MRARLFIRFVMIAVLALCSGVGAVRSEQNSPFGVVSAPGLANDVCRRNDLSALGVGWVRSPWSWNEIEIAKGNYQWDGPTRMMDDLTARDIWVYWDFSYAPCWANGKPCEAGIYGPGTATSNANKAYTPTNQADLREYVMAVVNRFRGYKVVWGAWNEVDLQEFYRPPSGGAGQKNVNQYVAAGRELRTIVNAIRAADPNAKIVVGELSTVARDNRGWLKQIVDAVGGKFDGISLHIYGKGGASPLYCDKRLASLNAFRTDLVAWGYGAYPVWVTETGGGVSDFGGTVNGQKAFMTCFWNVLKSYRWLKNIFWYRYEPETELTGLLDGGPAECTHTPNAKYYHYQGIISGWPSFPEQPAGLSASAGNGQVTLSWAAASGATTYHIKRTTVNTGHHVRIASASSTSYVDNTVSNDMTYYYVVSARNTAGESLDSDEASATPSATVLATYLWPGEVLYPGQEVTSPDGRFHLIYQGDGNLVLYRWDWVPIWNSQTAGTSAGFTAMQGDGNFVVYDASGAPVWSSGTNGHPDAYLAVQNDGNVAIYDPSGAMLWSTGTCCL